jgi:hypothetical protein
MQTLFEKLVEAAALAGLSGLLSSDRPAFLISCFADTQTVNRHTRSNTEITLSCN